MITISNISTLKFDAAGLIPAIVQDARTNRVLTLAYMNRESLELTLSEGRTVFWSRSRNTLWRKGETSGNVQRIVDIQPDCDGDSLLVLVERDGPACHTGADSCFDADGAAATQNNTIRIIDELHALLLDRRANPKEGSYTTYLFDKGLDKILKKIGEESTEVIIAAKSDDRAETVYELADLAYHALVLMVNAGISPDDVRAELASRHVVDTKIKQEKMASDTE
ncbi:MAG: bifunctional phosphoribosyl-AMP cyclohydrolase/phosphoribosyl-ATP diphosphatase HisIE [Oscillospiraceae bacterium]|jgi:phosphoribosyl-ATP pyrophosphohydrolase/phosphoribosyl-AMP cyclohydrolase|nr:bifunctional phosphoribosyl-AMP cyclohydrolase/phosphoribosyl-ATP diphosphatase HisIE [Oscillospiraceae bacterium]